jgi:hypothetical protein
MPLRETNDIGDVSAEIGLIEQDDRARAALMREDEVAFQTARVVVTIEPADDEEQVHVCGKDLLAEALARFLPAKLCAPGKDLGDDCSLAQDDPVANTGEILIEVAELATDGGGDFAACSPDDAVLAVY